MPARAQIRELADCKTLASQKKKSVCAKSSRGCLPPFHSATSLIAKPLLPAMIRKRAAAAESCPRCVRLRGKCAQGRTPPRCQSDCRIFPARAHVRARHAAAARIVTDRRGATTTKMGLAAATLDAFLATCFTWAVTAAGAALVFVLPPDEATQRQLLRPMLGFAGAS